MSDALKIINNIRTLRAQARELTLATLEEMLEKLTIVVEERREEEASFLKQQEEKQAKLEAFRQKLLEDGIDPAELLSLLAHLLPRPERNAPHVQLSIDMLIPMVRKRHGQVRAELLVLSLLRSKPVRYWKISRSSNLHTICLPNPLAHRWRFTMTFNYFVA